MRKLNHNLLSYKPIRLEKCVIALSGVEWLAHIKTITKKIFFLVYIAQVKDGMSLAS